MNGLATDNIIECPKQTGLFDYRTGEAKCALVRINLKKHAVIVEGGKVHVDVG